jgi:hypothetical protein
MMKNRITLTIDPAIVKRAKKEARIRNTSLSGLVEELLRSASLSRGENSDSFVDRWAGKFMPVETLPGDRRMTLLKAKHGLPDR